MSGVILRALPQNVCKLCRAVITGHEQVRQNSNRASITRIKRSIYAQMYPTLLVLPDGSTINVRYREPRKIIQLPVDLTTLSEEERLARLARRKPKQRIVIEEDMEDSFDINEYKHLWTKK